MRTILPRAVKPPIGISKKGTGAPACTQFLSHEDREGAKFEWPQKGAKGAKHTRMLFPYIVKWLHRYKGVAHWAVQF
jgi:hypothetical protein